MEKLGKRLDITKNGTLQKLMPLLMLSKETVVEIDASEVEIVNPAGLTMLAACREALEKTGTELRIIKPSRTFIAAAEQHGLDASLRPLQNAKRTKG